MAGHGCRWPTVLRAILAAYDAIAENWVEWHGGHGSPMLTAWWPDDDGQDDEAQEDEGGHDDAMMIT